jgi:hypothetical protein
VKKPPLKGKYTKESDEKMDKYLTKGLSKKEKDEFEKKDKAHGKKKKPKTLQEDLPIDKKIIKDIKKKRKK